MRKDERDIFDIINIKKDKEGGVKRTERKKYRKKKAKSAWAHHISTQPLLYVIHDRSLAADTLKGSQTATRRQQCHNVKITATKNKINITHKRSSNEKKKKYGGGKLINKNACGTAHQELETEQFTACLVI